MTLGQLKTGKRLRRLRFYYLESIMLGNPVTILQRAGAENWSAGGRTLGGSEGPLGGLGSVVAGDAAARLEFGLAVERRYGAAAARPVPEPRPRIGGRGLRGGPGEVAVAPFPFA